LSRRTSRRSSGAKRHQSADLDDALAFRIHRTNRLLRTHLSRFLDRHEAGLTPEQWFVVARLAHGQPMRQVALAEPVLGDPPNVTRLVDSLVARGLVERSPDPSDRRSWHLSLTRAGSSLANAINGDAVQEREQVFAGFDERELDALASALDRIDRNVRELLVRDQSGVRLRW
jgi:DNA-binding MarR family transcriptional regulator